MGDPDTYESVDATPDVSEFPVDTSTSGKHYQVAVPAYLPAASPAVGSYFRHGVPHSAASVYTDGTGSTSGSWSQNGSSIALGDDLLQPAVPPDGFESALGGVRDHTDGNRVVTSRKDVLEVIGGQYRQIILSNQAPTTDTDPDWAVPSSSNDEETSIVSHEYTSWFYELTSSSAQPGAGSYAEPRLKVADAKAKGYDYYEYANANNLIDIMAGESNLIEKMYAGRMLEVMSTVHASHSGWEGTIDDLSDGDLKEYMLGKNITEVIKAEHHIHERIEAVTGDITELMLAGGGINEVTTAGGGVHEMTSAGGVISEETIAGGLIHELTAAGGAVLEEIVAGLWVNELTLARGVVSEITMAGDVLLDVMFGKTAFIDVMAASQVLLEVITASLVVEVTAGKSIIEITLGDTLTFEEGHATVAETREELIEEASSMVGDNTELTASVKHITGACSYLAGTFEVV